ncbi:glycosyltransferase family 2 protein [Halocatena salina]|uniref:Glycosyltransferase family 2 protein n=1 Tax=Halocatena salina TaxID=2934340 RepID=A0A8U0A031_9EURY|nr:glycosyltransferase family 2 protein [Halocatena salina]UPM42404.1 glycosyltransferase family 2 protein [Halocatena salina]
MELSVVVPTLNGREHLVRCLDALSEHVSSAEIIVANGPSVDGTTGMVRRRDDVDVLVEIGERNINVARNAGIDRATGTVIAFLDYWLIVEERWIDAIRTAFDHVATAHRASGHGPLLPAVITGPVHRSQCGGVRSDTVDRRTINGTRVTYFDGGNVAFRRDALEAIDGFDESLAMGSARDSAHRLAHLGYNVVWEPTFSVRQDAHPRHTTENHKADTPGFRPRCHATDVAAREWDWRYRSLTYRLVKNYGFRSLWRVARHTAADVKTALTSIARGNTRPSDWLTNGRNIVTGAAGGLKDGFIARLRDRSPQRNPNGVSTRADRAVAVYDRRDQ